MEATLPAGMPAENFDELASKAIGGDASAAQAMLDDGPGLKVWLDKLAGRREGEGMGRDCPFRPTYAERTRPREGYLARGLPRDARDLVAQYQTISKRGAADFKSDIQGIERAILAGSVEALREMVERSPMALWAMDFSLAEYEHENVLAFAAKYAPVGADFEVVAYLRGRGARLPPCKFNAVVSASMAKAAGAWAKEPRHLADVFESAGHAFDAGDGLAMVASGMFERETGIPELPSVARQKVAWLDELERRGAADWKKPLSPEEVEAYFNAMEPKRPLGAIDSRKEQFLGHMREAGPIGIGAWMGMHSAPMRCEAAWAEFGPWLRARGLAREAYAAAEATGAHVTMRRLAPWRDAEELDALCAGASACEGGAGANRL